MSASRLPDDVLIQLRAEGIAQAAVHLPFVDARAAARAKHLLRSRGEQWAMSVLGRDISRRSLACPTLPALEDGEIETLVLADHAEPAERSCGR